MLPIHQFLRENARWLAGGFLLTFFSSYGQTFFIALSAGDIRFEYGLSHGEFGGLYMLATLASAATLPFLGQIVDRLSPRAVTLIVVPMLSLAALMMAFSQNIVLLFVTIYLLRLFAQGMMTQNAATAIARWFVAQRGRAMSVTVIGVNAGEALFPVIFVLLAAAIGWRNAWILSALTLLLVAAPLISWLMKVQRAPRASDPPVRKVRARDWTRAEVLRDPVFYLTLMGVLAPGFIGTTIFFHQIYLVDLRGWSLEVFASSFTFMAVTTVTFSLLAGQLVDRFSAIALLPSFLVPLAAACLVAGAAGGPMDGFPLHGSSRAVLRLPEHAVRCAMAGNVRPTQSRRDPRDHRRHRCPCNRRGPGPDRCADRFRDLLSGPDRGDGSLLPRRRAVDDLRLSTTAGACLVFARGFG